MTAIDTSFAAASVATSDLAKSIFARIEDAKGTGIKDIMEGRSDVFQINPFHINVADDFNGRDFSRPEVQEHIDQLAKSIAARGLRKALVIRREGTKFWLVDGECRLRATFRAINVYNAEIRTVRVELQSRFQNEADAVAAQFTDNSGLRFTSLEQVKPLKKLVNFGWSMEDIAATASMSIATLNRTLELDALPEAVKDMIRADQVSATTALDTFREHNEDGEATIAALTAGLEEATTAGRTKVTKRHLANAGATSKRPTAARMEKTLFDVFATATVNIDGVETSTIGEEVLPEGAMVSLTLTSEKFEEVRKLLNL